MVYLVSQWVAGSWHPLELFLGGPRADEDEEEGHEKDTRQRAFKLLRPGVWISPFFCWNKFHTNVQQDVSENSGFYPLESSIFNRGFPL